LTFPESAIFRIDHFLGREEIMNLLYVRFASSFLEPIWNPNYVAGVQITLAEDFGVGGRGAFYDTVGCLRDVVANHRFQIVARVKRAGEEFVGGQHEFTLLNVQLGAEQPYERLLGDALAGDRVLYTREDSVEAAWAVVDTVLENHPRALPYSPGSWGPGQADRLIAPHGHWHNPKLNEETTAPS
jgi:glucose-6-phosphate 1-dehydrogenase